MNETVVPSRAGDPPPTIAHPVARRRALRTIAIFEAIKGFTALAASLGLLSLLHRGLHQVAVALIGHFGLNPGDHYPLIILHYADAIADANLRSLVLLATAYIAVRLVEAYGLWFQHVWGEWLGALSGAIYVPFELRHLVLHPHWIGLTVLAGNLLVVGVLVHQLYRNIRSKGVTHLK